MQIVSGGLAYSMYNTFEVVNGLEIKAIPVINGMYDYGLSEIISIGGAISYQHISQSYSKVISVTSAGANKMASFVDEYNRTNVAFRLLVHKERGEQFDFYTGLRIGMTFWGYRFGSLNGYDGGKIIIFDRPYEKKGTLKFQAVLGARVYVSEDWGINGEVALGPSYFANLGVSYRFY